MSPKRTSRQEIMRIRARARVHTRCVQFVRSYSSTWSTGTTVVYTYASTVCTESLYSVLRSIQTKHSNKSESGNEVIGRDRSRSQRRSRKSERRQMFRLLLLALHSSCHVVLRVRYLFGTGSLDREIEHKRVRSAQSKAVVLSYALCSALVM